jgi:hypothetical protein
MENTSASITISNKYLETSNTSITLKEQRHSSGKGLSVMAILALLSIYALAGTHVTTNASVFNELPLEKTVAINDFKQTENKFKKRDYSFITSRGGREENLVYTNTIY